MKRAIIPLLLLTACSQNTLENDTLRLTANDRMQLEIEPAGPAAAAGTFLATDCLHTQEGDITDFHLTGSRRKGNRLEIEGRYECGGTVVEKFQVLTLPEGLDGMVTVETRFVNRGEPVQVRSLTLNRMELAADTLLWSFQPTSSARRNDWMLPIRPGFSQQNYLGMNDSDYGGGIPMVDLWRADIGLAVGLTEPVLKMISMPVEWPEGGGKRGLRSPAARLPHTAPPGDGRHPASL